MKLGQEVNLVCKDHLAQVVNVELLGPQVKQGVLERLVQLARKEHKVQEASQAFLVKLVLQVKRDLQDHKDREVNKD